MTKYKFKRVDEHGYIITEDGHTMFPEDVKTRLDRLNFLEAEKLAIYISLKCNENIMNKLERAREVWPKKSDEWLYERLDCELKQKVVEIQKLSNELTGHKDDLRSELTNLSSIKSNMKGIEEEFKIFDRPSADNSRLMADYIYKVIELLKKHLKKGNKE